MGCALLSRYGDKEGPFRAWEWALFLVLAGIYVVGLVYLAGLLPVGP